MLHLIRYARQYRQPFLPPLKPHPRSRPLCIDQYLTIVGNFSLMIARFAERNVPLFEDFPDKRERRLMYNQLRIKKLCDGLFCYIVMGWSKTASRNYSVSGQQSLLYRVFDDGQFIFYSHNTIYIHTDFCERLRQPAGIRIHDIADQQFVSYTYDLALHTVILIRILRKIEYQNINLWQLFEALYRIRPKHAANAKNRSRNYVHRLPNILSTIRLILAPVFLILYVQDEVVWCALSIAIFAVAVVTDFFDGYIARLYEAETSYGVFLDPLADKFLTFAGFICLPFIDATQFPWWAIGVIVLRDIIITSMRIVADWRNIPMETRLTAKIKTMSQMIFLYLVLLVGVFVNTDVWLSKYCVQLLESGILWWFMLIIVALTAYSGFEYIYINKNMFLTTHDRKDQANFR